VHRAAMQRMRMTDDRDGRHFPIRRFDQTFEHAGRSSDLDGPTLHGASHETGLCARQKGIDSPFARRISPSTWRYTYQSQTRASIAQPISTIVVIQPITTHSNAHQNVRIM